MDKINIIILIYIEYISNMNTTRKTICLNMIVKNECHIIEETLKSVSKYIDYWVISDTGSTDGTMEKIKTYFKKEKIPGELLQHKWKDFGYNRSKAIKACFNKADYVLIIDADDIIIGDLIFPENMDADGYYLKFNETFTYYRTQILENRKLKWHYVGILHEYVECLNKTICDYKHINGNYYIDSRRMGSRSKNSLKYLDDAEKLVNEINKYPNSKLNARYCFYAGQSYYDHKDYENSIKYYEKRITYGGWYEEVYYSYYRIGMSLLQTDRNDEIINAFKKAYQYLPSRCEPLYQLGIYYKNIKNYQEAYKYLRQSIEIQFPTNQILFLFKYMYDYGCKYELAIVTNRMLNYEESYEYCKQLLAQTNLPEYESHVIEHLQNINIKHIQDRYIDYNIKIVKIISNFISNNKTNNISENITLSITTCKRYDLFEKTINSFIQCCTDIFMITRYICVDDNSSEEDRIKMKTNYPFFEFVMKDQSNKGHIESMNIIIDMVKTPYLIHIEDDMKFFDRRSYIKQAIEIMEQKGTPQEHIPLDQNIETKEIAQVLFNKNYIETEYRPVYGGYKMLSPNNLKYIIHEYYPQNTPQYEQAMNKYKNKQMCIYWPHYSLRASILKTKIFQKLGKYKNINGFFERDYAENYVENNYISAFFDSITYIHIGKLSWESSDKKANAYKLNDISQFTNNNITIIDNECDVYDDYDFYPNQDSFGNDIGHYNKKTIKELKDMSDKNHNCVGFNTYGYLKHKIVPINNFIYLKNMKYSTDGIYIKKQNQNINEYNICT